MPATRLQDMMVESLSRYDVVGEDGEVTRFVHHVGLVSGEIPEVRVGDSVPVNSIRPLGPESGDKMAAHVIGTASLTFGQANQIKTFVEENWGEQASQRKLGPQCFVIRPHAKPVRDGNGTTVCMRFSCVGFVIQAYRDADIDLLDTDEETLPSVKRKTIGKVYPVVLHPSWAEWNEEYEWGLDENEKDWPVVLPGYVFHALNRDVTEIRQEVYKARLGDEVFPR